MYIYVYLTNLLSLLFHGFDLCLLQTQTYNTPSKCGQTDSAENTCFPQMYRSIGIEIHAVGFEKHVYKNNVRNGRLQSSKIIDP